MKAALLTDRHIDRLWERMSKIYGHKWVSSYGVADDGTWTTGLHDVTPEQIGAGLEKCRVSTEAWPPTLPEFRTMCVGVQQHKSAAYRPHLALPRPSTDKVKAAAGIMAMRGLLINKINPHDLNRREDDWVG